MVEQSEARSSVHLPFDYVRLGVDSPGLTVVMGQGEGAVVASGRRTPKTAMGRCAIDYC